jgi:hypothetical protein
VNETIQRHHEDASSIRRELIGEGLMQRENGLYWRVERSTPASVYEEGQGL